MVRYKSKKPFSSDAKDWGKGKFVTDTTQPRKGVIDFAISPDGKQMVAVANFDADAFQLYLGKPKDVLLTDAKPLGVQACKVAWRSDNLGGRGRAGRRGVRNQGNGQIVRVPLKNPAAQQRLVFSGDSPDFQPLTLESSRALHELPSSALTGADYCGHCGTPVAGAPTRSSSCSPTTPGVPLVGDDDRARAGEHDVVLSDPSVSREHARISPGGNGGGSASRTRARAPARSSTAVAISRATLAARRREAAARRADAARRAPPRPRRGRPHDRGQARREPASSPALGPPGVEAAATQFGMKPRVRSGYALKRLDASEGAKRWVLKDLNRNTFLRLSDNDAQLFELLDGTHSLSDLIGIAEQRHGPAGAPRLARCSPTSASAATSRASRARPRSPRSPRGSWRGCSSRART